MLTRYLIFVAPIAVGAMALLFLFRPSVPVGEEAQIARVIAAVEKAASDRSVPGMLEHVSERYEGEGGWSKRDLQAYLARLMFARSSSEALVTRRHIEVDGEKATADLSVVLSGGSSAQDTGAYRIVVGFAREEGQWRVVSSSHRPAGARELFVR